MNFGVQWSHNVTLLQYLCPVMLRNVSQRFSRGWTTPLFALSYYLHITIFRTLGKGIQV